MQAEARATLLASSKETNWHYPHCQEGKSSWCIYNQVKANDINTNRPDPGHPLLVIVKLSPICDQLSDESILKICLHDLAQNQSESFNATIWDRIPKIRYGLQLEFGVYNAVANSKVGRKCSMFTYEKMNDTWKIYP